MPVRIFKNEREFIEYIKYKNYWLEFNGETCVSTKWYLYNDRGHLEMIALVGKEYDIYD